jgi:hypothetical protein
MSGNMDSWKSRGGKSQRRQKKEGQRRQRKKKEDRARKGRKVAKHYVFPMFRGSGGSKSKWRKHHMFGPLLEVEMSKIFRPSLCEAHFEVKM